ncbi:MAG: tetratricopeptide repeat-containing sulfotransferase family protein [Luteimonas sp.]
MDGLDAKQVARLHAAARASRDGLPAQAEALLQAAIAATGGHPEALRLLGILRNRARRPHEARELFLRALATRPDDAVLLSDLGSAQMNAGDGDAAFASWRRACALAPGEPAPWYNLGRNLQLQGRGEEAAPALEQALALAPGLVPAAVLLGDARTHLGDFTAAAEAYRQALRADPGCGDAWRGLCAIRDPAPGAADVRALESQLARNDLRETDRIAMEYALGRPHARDGDYPRAFARIADANARQRRLAPWSASALAGYVDAALAATGRLPAPPDPTLGREAIFIVGLPRSGSTLFEQVLAAHPQVEGASELPDLGEVVQQESLRRGKPYPRWVPEATAADWQRLGREYLQRTARWRGRRPRFTDKLPENWKHAGILRAMLPGATVIEVRRDPLETAWSCFRQQFLALPHFGCDFGDIAAQLRGCERAMDAWRERDPARIHLFRYEALVATPEPAIRALLDACGLGFDPACLAPHAVRRGVRTASAAQVREPLRAPAPAAPRYGALLDPLRAALAT